MAKEVEAQNDLVIPRGAARASQFLGVIQKTCQDEGLDINLHPTERGWRDKSIVLRSPLKVGRGNQVELEVFADPQGNSLHVGWQATRQVAGSIMSNTGLGREMQWARNFTAGKAGNERALSGALTAFDSLVFQPVVQQLVDALRAEQGPSSNGFMGN